MKLTVKNWAKFQHYRDRNPPWIKLHKSLLDDQHWHALPDASKALAVSLWLIASESKDGSFDGDSATLAFRLRTDSKKIETAIKPLKDHGFLVVDSSTLADCGQLAVSETEREGETETDGSSIDKPIRFNAKKFLTDRGVDEKLVAEFFSVRKTKNLTNTETAFVAIEKEVEKAGITFQQAITRCVIKSWAGFKASWTYDEDGSGVGAATENEHIIRMRRDGLLPQEAA